jgi:SAM-dependent methyltransferase
VTEARSAELRDEYEQRYTPGGEEELARNIAWRALCAANKADHVAALLGRAGKRPASIVEVGCGDGVLLAELARRGIGDRHHGFDISSRAADAAAGRLEIERAERFDGASLPVADGAYDLAVLSHVLEHVPDPAPLLAEAARAARAVVVEVPLEDNRSASRPAAQRGREELGHVHRFARSNLHALAHGAGLRVEHELSDPLPLAIHAFHATGPAARARAGAKAAVRRTLFAASPGLAERSFTVHYVCLLRR